MGNNGSRPSSRDQEGQMHLLMQQNSDIAKLLSRQQGSSGGKRGGLLHLLNMTLSPGVRAATGGAAGEQPKKQIKIDGVTYDIIEFINKGGFGEVHKAQIHGKNRTVAIKIMRNTPDILEEVQNEIRFLSLTRRIPIDNHPIICYHGSQITKENILIAMELASCDLATFWFTKVAEVDPENKFLVGITIIVYVLRALTFLEELCIIHGDIKPQNLVIVPNDDCFYIKLIDFGTVEKMDTSRVDITVDASKAHTIFFASPEFLKRNSRNIIARRLSKKSDAWAAGVMFYFLFFGRLPWKDQFDYDNFCNDPDAKDVVVSKESGFKKIIELLLKKNPAQRASAKSTLRQMGSHPASCNLVNTLHDNFCPVTDVCGMKVPDEIRDGLAALARPGHLARASSLDASRPSESRSSCRYGRSCYRRDAVHREDYAHPGDPDYKEPGDNFKIICWYGADCYRRDQEHFRKYSHPDGCVHGIPRAGNDARPSMKRACQYGKSCYNKNRQHREEYSHPSDSSGDVSDDRSMDRTEKQICKHGTACYNTNPDHREKYVHPRK